MQSRRFFVACFFSLFVACLWVFGTDESGDLLKNLPARTPFVSEQRREGWASILMKDVVSLATAFIGK
jgi:hypothetical protein